MKGAAIRLLCLVLFITGLHGQDPRPDPVREPEPTPTPEPATRSYFILAPNTIRLGLPLSLSVSILDSQSDVTVTAMVLKGKDTWATATDTFSSGATGILSIDIPDTDPGTGHMLRVEGSGGLTFSQTQDLKFSPTSFSILVQTDKAIYKPGQTVHFRAMAVDPNLKPYIGAFDVQLKDPSDNVIQQWMGLENQDYGVVSGKSVMSDAPVLGDWVLTVTANNQQYEHIITIDEYVLPKFEVIITPQPYVLLSDPTTTVTVEAKYTYGEPVMGSASMRIFSYDDESSHMSRFEIDGKAETVVDLLQLEEALPTYTFSFSDSFSVNVQVNVTERLTGIQQSGEAQIRFEGRPVKVEEAPGNPGVFKPGLLYTFFVQVTHPDGTPLSATQRQQKLSVTVNGNTNDPDTLPKLDIPEDGLVRIDISFDTSNNWPSVEVFYYEDGYGKLYKNPQSAISETNNFLQIVPQATDYEAGSTANFQIKTTEAVEKLSYQVFSKGTVVLSDTLSSAPSTLLSLSFGVTEVMAPQARLVVSYVRSAGVHELIMDSVDLSVNGVFQNEVTVGFSSGEVKPGDSIMLDVTAQANSYVGILAIDTSVRLLKTGNDITQGQVIDALGEYDTGKSNDDSDICPGCRFFWFPFPTPGNTATEVLDEAGILVFTDALVYEDRTLDYYFREGDIAFDAVPEAAVPVADMAEEGGSPPQDNGVSKNPAPTRIRTKFPETWLWRDYVAGADGRVTVSSVVPDTITSWVASAFSMSREAGIGVASTPAKVTVVQEFFVSLALPYSIVRGEACVLSTTVFNYHSKEIKASVTLSKSDEYQVVTNDKDYNEINVSESQTKEVTVPAGSGYTVLFVLLPNKLGMVSLSVSATSSRASDAVIRQILVVPEGIPASYSEPLFVDLAENQGSLTKTFTFGFPADNVVPGSVRAELTFTGDIMGPTIGGLDKLLQMPSGCGEQTMLSFAPDVFIHSYLTSTNQNNPVVLQKAIDFMIQGYQRELTYKHSDGSFSAFGESDDSGSTWLTAFVVKSFAQAMPAIFIDSDLLRHSVQWMIQQQAPNGVFNEPGRVIHTNMQGGISSEATMTAYVLITLEELENRKDELNWDPTFWSQVEASAALATGYLEGEFDFISLKVYPLALVTYALTLADSTEAGRFLTALEGKAIEEDGIKHWSKADVPSPVGDCWDCAYYAKPSSDIEMTGYALLTYVAKNDIGLGAKVARWLTNQRNEYGGYSSTQDTVIGLQALTAYASNVGMTPRDISAEVTATEAPDYSQTIVLNANNSIVLQKVELPVTSGDVTAILTGTGTCLVQFSAFYNLKSVPVEDVFEVIVTPTGVDKNTVRITACGKYVGPMEETGMAMMMVNLPSGFYPDEDLLREQVAEHENLAKYEVARSTVNFYLHMTERGVMYCYTVLARREEIVIHIKPSNVKMFDYYKPADQTVISYSVESLADSSLCDSCPQCCGIDNGGPHTTAQILLVAVAALLALLY